MEGKENRPTHFRFIDETNSFEFVPVTPCKIRRAFASTVLLIERMGVVTVPRLNSIEPKLVMTVGIAPNEFHTVHDWRGLA
jgi:hypothetical protein